MKISIISLLSNEFVSWHFPQRFKILSKGCILKIVDPKLSSVQVWQITFWKHWRIADYKLLQLVSWLLFSEASYEFRTKKVIRLIKRKMIIDANNNYFLAVKWICFMTSLRKKKYFGRDVYWRLLTQNCHQFKFNKLLLERRKIIDYKLLHLVSCLLFSEASHQFRTKKVIRLNQAMQEWGMFFGSFFRGF